MTGTLGGAKGCSFSCSRGEAGAGKAELGAERAIEEVDGIDGSCSWERFGDREDRDGRLLGEVDNKASRVGPFTPSLPSVGGALRGVSLGKGFPLIFSSGTLCKLVWARGALPVDEKPPGAPSMGETALLSSIDDAKVGEEDARGEDGESPPPPKNLLLGEDRLGDLPPT